MTEASKMKKCFYSVLIAILVLSGVAVTGFIISTPQAVFSSQAPEPQCVCAGCGKKCGSGHTSSCPYRPK